MFSTAQSLDLLLKKFILPLQLFESVPFPTSTLSLILFVALSFPRARIVANFSRHAIPERRPFQESEMFLTLINLHWKSRRADSRDNRRTSISSSNETSGAHLFAGLDRRKDHVTHPDILHGCAGSLPIEQQS
jgi:hypothetical protein